MVDSPQCTCGFQQEDANHYLLMCGNYTIPRNKLRHAVQGITDELNVDTLLFGKENLTLQQNQKLFSAVHTFILESDRL